MKKLPIERILTGEEVFSYKEEMEKKNRLLLEGKFYSGEFIGHYPVPGTQVIVMAMNEEGAIFKMNLALSNYWGANFPGDEIPEVDVVREVTEFVLESGYIVSDGNY
jgi:hypothetical protein